MLKIKLSKPHISLRKIHINFNDSKISLKSKTMNDLLRSFLVYNICRSRYIVQNANYFLKNSYNILGNRFTNYILKYELHIG